MSKHKKIFLAEYFVDTQSFSADSTFSWLTLLNLKICNIFEL